MSWLSEILNNWKNNPNQQPQDIAIAVVIKNLLKQIKPKDKQQIIKILTDISYAVDVAILIHPDDKKLIDAKSGANLLINVFGG